MGYFLGVISDVAGDVASPLNTLTDTIRKQYSQEGYERKHSDGWGIGFYQHRSAYLIKKSSPIETDNRLTSVTQKIQSHLFIAQIREASIGEIKVANTQPFRYGSWLFAHQGTLNHFRRIRSQLLKTVYPPLKKKLKGSTDSEHCFALFLTLLRGTGYLKGKDSTINQTLLALGEMLQSLEKFMSKAKINEPSIYNSIVSNGNFIVAIRRGAPLYTQKINLIIETRDSLIPTPTPVVQNGYLISSLKFGEISNWIEIPDNSFYIVTSELEEQIIPIEK